MAIYSYLLIDTKTRAFHICESIYSGVTVTFYGGSSGMLFVLLRDVICFIEGCPCVIEMFEIQGYNLYNWERLG